LSAKSCDSQADSSEGREEHAGQQAFLR
jgi:hypothetical protein